MAFHIADRHRHSRNLARISKFQIYFPFFVYFFWFTVHIASPTCLTLTPVFNVTFELAVFVCDVSLFLYHLCHKMCSITDPSINVHWYCVGVCWCVCLCVSGCQSWSVPLLDAEVKPDPRVLSPASTLYIDGWIRTSPYCPSPPPPSPPDSRTFLSSSTPPGFHGSKRRPQPVLCRRVMRGAFAESWIHLTSSNAVIWINPFISDPTRCSEINVVVK